MLLAARVSVFGCSTLNNIVLLYKLLLDVILVAIQ